MYERTDRLKVRMYESLVMVATLLYSAEL